MNTYPKEYVDYLVYYHADRDFFECHEVMEEYWKTQKGTSFEKLWLALIQVAVSAYHHRRGNSKGALKMLESALKQIDPMLLEQLGIAGEAFIQQLTERWNTLKKEEDPAYKDMNFPIQDQHLLELCKQRSRERQVIWGSDSNLQDHYLIHKHSLRDRSEIIKERERQKEIKQQQRKGR